MHKENDEARPVGGKDFTTSQGKHHSGTDLRLALAVAGGCIFVLLVMLCTLGTSERGDRSLRSASGLVFPVIAGSPSHGTTRHTHSGGKDNALDGGPPTPANEGETDTRRGDIPQELFTESVTETSSNWSFNTLEAAYKSQLAQQVYPQGDVNVDTDLLFIDGREECEASRGFLVSVRQSGFLGKIVFMVYYASDEAACKRLAADFAPMEVFYRDTPKWEMTLVQYHGVTNYFEANPDALQKHTKAAVVKPDDVVWCSNPFVDVPLLTGSEPVIGRKNAYKGQNLTALSLFAVIGHQTDVHPDNYEFFDRPFAWTEKYTNLEMPGPKRIIDHFIAGSPMALFAYCKRMVTFAMTREFEYTKASFNIVNEFDTIKDYLTDHLHQLEPRHRYEAANCYYYLPPDPRKGITCDSKQHSLIVGTIRCMRKVTYPQPHYTPFCKQPYREAINEVPSDLSMEGIAYDRVLAGARAIRNASHARLEGSPNNIFSEAADPQIGITDECPNGVLGVLTMMHGYRIDMVERFIASFLRHGDNKCTRMIMMISPHDGLERLAGAYPGRIEHVILDEHSPYKAETLGACKAPADRRFEVVQRWLEVNYKRFRYIMATDSRDYLFLADPLAQLVKILKAQGYEGKDFVGSVAESFTAGGATHPHHLASFFLTEWVKSCGKLCYRAMAKRTFTNGEPFALLNSGHMLGTSLGLLHYFRFHVRMIIESGHACDGSDQGLMTYYMYGMLQEAHYPHKVFVLSSSRSGFGNMPAPHRMSRRVKDGSYEYTLLDCNNNVYAGLHQFDRYQEDFARLANNENILSVWAPMHRNGTFDSFFKPSL